MVSRISRRRTMALVGAAAGIAVVLGGVWVLRAQTRVAAAGAAPLTWAECQPEQADVMILGTYHFAQVAELDDILRPERQRELAAVLERLEEFAPDRIAVEAAHTRSDELLAAYRDYLTREPDSLGSRNEIRQVGFRLARRLGHDRVHPVDVPMNLWDDSITVFDERWPGARGRLRAEWDARFESRDPRALAGLPLAEVLAMLNADSPPGNSDLYGNFLPLVEDEVYAGALKLRPWYDRNLRIVQNLFRILESPGERALLVIGSGHLRVLKQILEVTPQLCPVSALPYLRSAGEAGE